MLKVSSTPTGRRKEAVTTVQRLDRLTGIVELLPATVVAHDNQIEGLIKLADRNQKAVISLERQLQAYLKRLPPQ